MNWELIGWLAITASGIVIVASFFTPSSVRTASGAKLEPDTPPLMHTLLEVAWPLLFIACMAMLTFKDVMGFAAVLLTATVLTGVIWVVDALAFRRRRTVGAPDPVLVEMAKSFFPVILIVFLLRSFLYEPFKIPSGSMVPSLLVGDFILVDKYTYGIRLPVINKKIVELNHPRRGDVMVFRYPENPSKDFIKRVIGTPGDTVEYRNKRLIVNGMPVRTEATGTYTDTEGGVRFFETYREYLSDKPHAMMVDPRYPSLHLGQVRHFPNKNNCHYNDDGMKCVVPAGHYFMMGDSRDNSDDGRYWGFVPDANIVGRAVLVWMNFGELKRIGTRIE